MVRTVKLNDGKVMPTLSWGNMGGPKKALEAGTIAIQAGIHHIDCAQVYRTEGEVLPAIKAAGLKREDVFVTTKLTHFQGRNAIDAQHGQFTDPDPAIGFEEIKASVKRSIDTMGFIPDLLLIHNPYIPAEGTIGEFWGHLETLVEDGTLKGCSLGLSNFRPVDIEEVMKVAKIKPVVNQIEWHPYVLVHLDPLMEVHSKYAIVTQAYAALTPVHRHPTGGPLKPVLTRLAKQLSSESGIEVDEAGVLILYTVCKGVVCVTSSGDAERIKKMAGTEKVRDLTGEEIKEIETVGRKVHFRHWVEHMTNEFPDPDLPSDL